MELIEYIARYAHALTEQVVSFRYWLTEQSTAALALSPNAQPVGVPLVPPPERLPHGHDPDGTRHLESI